LQLRLGNIHDRAIPGATFALSALLMSAMWISIFALCSLLSALYSMTITHKPMEKFSYGLARVPVLAVFSTTVLAQLFSIFLSKESFEHLLSPGHQGTHDAAAAHEHETGTVGDWPYFVGAIATSISLFLSAYALKNQPFQHVLTASSSSSLQEHAADICHAICWVVPGLARLLLPRINSMVLLAAVTSGLLVLCEHFSYMHSEIPNRWKHAFVTPIPKKPPHGLVSNYRPISITSVFSRIFEKILKVALVNHIETHEVIPKNQYGFRVGRSTET
uniref:Reverse transcriptase domain-containing protein n=1 Tax=Heligmosomoides polygyrus TaxID=6339 RepID=A0A183FDC5_HELPZ